MASESSRERRKSAWRAQICVKSEIRERFNTVRQILKSDPLNRTKEEVQILIDSEEIVKEIQQRAQKQAQAKSRMLEVGWDITTVYENMREPILMSCIFQVLDPPEVLEDKSRVLAEAIRQAKCVVVYTGAGISTVSCQQSCEKRIFVFHDSSPCIIHKLCFSSYRRPQFLIIGSFSSLYSFVLSFLVVLF